MKWQSVLLVSVMLLALVSCGGGDSTSSGNGEDTIQGLHIVAALYDEGDPTNIDDNVMTIYFNEDIDPASLPPTQKINQAFEITGQGDFFPRSIQYELIDGFVPRLQITLESSTIAPEIGVSQIALNDAFIHSASGDVMANNAFVTFEAPYKLLKTGQTESYDDNGVTVAAGSLEDDGYFQKGQASSYKRDDVNGIVSDAVTGLMWQDTIPIGIRTWLTADNYASKNWSDTSGDTAATYCQTLSLGGHDDWRLPELTELLSIMKFGKASHSIDDIFSTLYINHYWSSTDNIAAHFSAWGVQFLNPDVKTNLKDISDGIRCVRNQ